MYLYTYLNLKLAINFKMNNDYINSIVLKYKQKKGIREMEKNRNI